MEAFATDRLVMRAWTHDQSDVERLFDTYSRWEVARWLGATPRTMQTLDEAHRAVDRWADRSVGAYGVWAVTVRATGAIAGTVLLVPLPEPADGAGQGEVEIGWHFHPDSWGQGYGSEAASATLTNGFAAGLKEIFAVVRPENDRSRALCARIGMAHLGQTDRWYGTTMELYRSGS